MIILVDKIFSKCCCDYYDQRKTAALNPEKIGVASKCAGIDPKIVFKNLYVHPAYNQQHQPATHFSCALSQ
jgi:hypothetical protein